MGKESTDHLLTNVENGIMQLTLNRPDSLNAFSSEMIIGLKEAMKRAGSDENVRVVTLSGAGRSFTAGGDVKTMGTASAMETYEHIGELNEVILSIKKLEKPVIACVHGFAAGAGFNLALACDIILAAEESKFAMSFSQVGLVSDGGGSYFLPNLIGPYLAKELLFSAEPLSAERAHALGIINHVYPVDAFERECTAFATRIANGPSATFGFIKKLVDQSLITNLETILEQERITQATLVSTEDHKEGVQAFKEKRKPNFRNTN
ncbi:MAG TPA: enoyl-CoA hydratase [Pseudogracilibacillus sp.]|nr:enoyl-CoA hydratase [Pseudogracilibacillus sp.]